MKEMGAFLVALVIVLPGLILYPIAFIIMWVVLAGCSCPSVYFDTGPGRRPFILPEPKEQHSHVEPITQLDYPAGWGAGLIWVSAIGEK